jgi:hypothetical protein
MGLLAGPEADASVVEFTFTGTVTSANGIYSAAPVGAVVAGTYRFDLDAAVPGQGTGTPGSYDGDVWTVASVGGSFYLGYPDPPAALVFTTSGRVHRDLRTKRLAVPGESAALADGSALRLFPDRDQQCYEPAVLRRPFHDAGASAGAGVSLRYR